MKILRGILAVALIAMLLIGNLVEGAAHAETSDCIGGHCHSHMPSGDNSGMDPSHEDTDGDPVTYDCCNQIFCQAVALCDHPTMTHPLGLQSTSWLLIGQLTAVNWPRTLERPPNS